MFLKTLQWRLVSFFCLLSICLVIPIGFVLNRSVEDLYYNNFVETLDNAFATLEADIGNRELDTEEIKRSVSSNALYFLIGEYKSYTIFNKPENTIVDSTDPAYDPEEKGKFMNELLSSPNFVKAMKGESGDNRSGGAKEFFDYAKPVGINRDFILYFRYYKLAWQHDIANYNSIIIRSLAIAVVVAFILGYLLSKTITGPVVKIMYKAQSVAAGDFDQTLEVKSDDEIGKLTSTFNYMADSLKKTLIEISSEKNKIETILNYMTDGVIAFNLKGEVIHTNPASRKMFEDELSDKSFDEYAEKYGLKLKIEDILNPGDITSKEANLVKDDKILRVYFAVFTDESKRPEGLIAVLQDITEQEKLERMRKDFVANVSHEMRTPLTSIKSYTETLLDGALDDRDTTERFLSVINSEADRMTRLVKDLLQLTRLDNQRMQWKLEPVPIARLVKAAVEKMELEAGNKRQTLEYSTMGELPEIIIDHDRIEQVLINILGNALKYTQEGGRISVSVGRNANNVYVKVSDNGIGIPEKDLPRLFERFYRVDKARSREMGGTGLGLSIAKDIVEAHKGRISIASQYGKGTEVIVWLPVGAEETEAEAVNG